MFEESNITATGTSSNNEVECPIQHFLTECKSNPHLSMHMHSLGQVQALVFNAALSEKETLSTLDYLCEQQDAQQLGLVLDIIALSGRLWCFKPSTLSYFKELRVQNELVFQALLGDLKNQIAPEARHLKLEKKHIEIVIDLLQIQNMLFQKSNAALPNIISQLDDYLKQSNLNAKDKINKLRETYLPYITVQATAQNLLHHTIKHAFEIKMRVMYIVQQIMVFFASQEASDTFLRQIIRFAIECHDYKQKKMQDGTSAEEETAKEISQSLIQSLFNDAAIHPPEEIKQFISFIVHYVIVLGTTMLYSPQSTLDLFELFNLFEKAQQTTRPVATDEDSLKFLQQLKAVTLVTSICDKVPAAIYQVVEQQVQHETTNSLKTLKRYHALRDKQGESKTLSEQQEELVIETFFKQLIPYYGSVDEHIEINQQAFLMAIVPHVCMRIELSTTNPNAIQLIEFINYFQNLHQTAADETFLATFDKHFAEKHIFETMSELFFDVISKEINFCLSQTNTLNFAAQQLDETFIWINPEVPQIDADNLQKFAVFFEHLTPENRMRLTRELVLNTILQAGTIYTETPDVILDHSPRPIQNTSRFKRKLDEAVRLSHTRFALFPEYSEMEESQSSSVRTNISNYSS